ncbi:hypothetical protein L226DRAFT_544380 [Lentinus tigrinus ALCF2SS1-7]|uniref:Uncharacterized protein n=1 Tax=Lentinus tigrinus ALCF2SS1-6 TaxID=1328759 RepID=A0A5C2SEI2_9APHY|nr:hypothetical protein L227DRAFT_499148 [Lentinus tigrinus ALCF2SS1-6]RPD78000.1 hypothetical protein L226DRAFT_544380 [Lentinus tigrinus ALCF2SS1-7]
MLASSSRHAPPEPRQTAPPVPVQQGMKRRRIHGSSHDRAPRDTSIADQAAIDAAVDQCFDSPNNVVTCYPNSSTTVAQHEWATIVWNSRLPQWAQTNFVNLYLFQADSGNQVLNVTNVVNPTRTAGQHHVQIDDRWWGSRGENWNGQNVSFPFYWLVTRNDRPIENSDVPQATFTAVQTTFADSVIASMSSASAASSRSAASASSASAASVSASLTAQTSLPTTTSAGATGTDASGNPSASGASVQGGSNGGSFPKWAIAVIVVLGFFALLATGILIFYMVRRFHRRRDGTLSHRNSMGSSTPMMANAGPQSPVIGTSALDTGAGVAAGYGAGAYTNRRASTGGDGHDGASMTSRTSDAGPFSGADAAIMANAFRQALRKPDFADTPVEEGESPDEHPGHGHAELLNHELAEEGRDIRSVGSSRGVRVETLSSEDGNDTATVQDHQY